MVSIGRSTLRARPENALWLDIAVTNLERVEVLDTLDRPLERLLLSALPFGPDGLIASRTALDELT
jgi:hypothetical protein